ncbi:type II CAAX endopeptidase family protein [Lactobacillus sp.]|uniref:CPBP family intramembrane glutamic endopeptidase n=1 Tax=Lactobacillus sp. TaxID=1591 RepID=UPI001993BE10|nr:type II CAAX endopeptidase family protein [Lactobacillus sp.]MBD5429941.1 CPBP family intramembrane metalloprotease [Lactobacillus sp.]
MRFIGNILKWLVILFLGFVILIIMEFPAIFVTPSPSNATVKFNFWHNVSLVIGFAILSFILEYLVCWWAGNKINFFKKISFKKLILAISSGIALYIVETLMTMNMKGGTGETSLYGQTMRTSLCIPLWITIAVITPTLEELFFQGLIQKGILKFLNPWVSMIITAVFFGVMHAMSFSLIFFVHWISGMVLAYVYYKTDDIKVPIITHGMFNLILLIQTGMQFL